jgi:hypothetical protein
MLPPRPVNISAARFVEQLRVLCEKSRLRPRGLIAGLCGCIVGIANEGIKGRELGEREVQQLIAIVLAFLDASKQKG